MKTIFEYVFGGFAALLIILLFAPFFGGLAGWIFAWIFNDSFKALMSLLNWQVTGFEAGAALGFLGSFFKSTLTSK